jgi:hypothetical protein
MPAENLRCGRKNTCPLQNQIKIDFDEDLDGKYYQKTN